MKRRFDMTLSVQYDRTVEDSEDALAEEMDELQAAVSKAVSTHVPKQFRGAIRVTITRSLMGNPS